MVMKPYIIAEVGSNWATLDDCTNSIKAAKDCGADAVKFQLFDHKSLYGQPLWQEHATDGVIWHTEKDMSYALPIDWLPTLKRIADSVEIDFMCSAFSPELIDAVDPYVKAHKVASAEMCHVRMLEKLKAIGKPVYLSTGAHTYEEIEQALKILGETPVTLMYCTAAYPAKCTQTDRIGHMKSVFKIPVGFSDHTLDILESPGAALDKGAVAFEKHVNFVGATGPDAPHSLNGTEFSGYVHTLKNKWSIFGLPTRDELPMITTHNRRLIAIKDIEPGDKLIEGENFGIYRALKPTYALTPFEVDKVNGKIAKGAIKAGDGISTGVFE